MKQQKEYQKRYQVIIVATSLLIFGISSCNVNTAIDYKNYCNVYTDIVELNNREEYGNALNRINAFEKGRDSFIVQYQKAVSLFGLGETSSSLGLIKMLYTKYSTKVNVNYILAYQYATMGQYDSSFYYSNKAIDLKGGEDLNMQTVAPIYCGITNDDILMEEIMYIRALSYYNLGYFSEAKKDWLYCNYRGYNPSYVFQSLADVYEALGQVDSSIYFQNQADLLLIESGR